MTSRQISAARSLATPYLARAVVLLLFLPATASSDVIRLTAADDRELVIEPEDPEVEVTIKGEQTVGIVDRKTGRE